MNIESRKHTLRVLLLIAAIGIMMDGVTTIVGMYLGIAEGNPIAGMIGLEASLIIRVIVVGLLYLVIEKASKPKELSRLTWLYSILLVVMWLTAFFNASMIALILAYG